MKLIHAARFTGSTAFAAGIYSFLLLRPLFSQYGQTSGQQMAAEVSPLYLELGGWLLLLAIFAWMVFLVTVMHTYSPVHRISTNLQKGLLPISATLLIASVLVGMVRVRLALPDLTGDSAADVSLWPELLVQIALTTLGAGLFMGGGLTAWICVDLVLLKKLPAKWMAPGAFAGILSLFSPLLLPNMLHLLAALIAYLAWCLVFGLKRALPPAYPDLN